MKIEKTAPEEVFKPYKLVIEVETEREDKLLRTFIGYNATLPRAARNAHGAGVNLEVTGEQLENFGVEFMSTMIHTVEA